MGYEPRNARNTRKGRNIADGSDQRNRLKDTIEINVIFIVSFAVTHVLALNNERCGVQMLNSECGMRNETGKSGIPFCSVYSVYSVCSVVGRFHCNGLRTTECTEYTEREKHSKWQ